MTTIRAAAADVLRLQDINTLAVVFAERPDGGGERLELQRALSFDEQDRELGLDTYCLCVSSGTAHYGGIASWSLDERGLAIQLFAEAARELGLDEEVRVEVQLEPSLRARLLNGLHEVLAEVSPKEP